jgi:hypothetical protein
MTVLSAVTGTFARPDTVIVAVGNVSRRIERIELRYSPDFNLSGLQSALASQFQRMASDRRWDNRTTIISFYPGGPQMRPRVVLMDPRFEREVP